MDVFERGTVKRRVMTAWIPTGFLSFCLLSSTFDGPLEHGCDREHVSEDTWIIACFLCKT